MILFSNRFSLPWLVFLLCARSLSLAFSQPSSHTLSKTVPMLLEPRKTLPSPSLSQKIRNLTHFFFPAIYRSLANPIPDYYAEKVGSLKDYRHWLRDQRTFMRKVLHENQE